MEAYTLKRTSVWGDTQNTKSMVNFRRLSAKGRIRQYGFPIIDHPIIYTIKPKGQRNTKESQTFIASYSYSCENEDKFIEKINKIGLRFYKEPCVFRNHPAYRVLVMDTDVNLDIVLPLLKLQENLNP
jgi:hypothetical protein